ncbi:MAG: 3-dehydroquinate synthase [Paludibacteraceae bacterium]|nr:3-dehydroquinate synthase [Paludibacteraceae bacterium]
MLCTDINTALAPFTARYERGGVVVVMDSCLSFETAYPVLRIETGEAQKSLETVTRIWDFFFEHGLTRSGLVICIGGGVLTDIAGFAAATYKRGVDYINVPTTLLAMIDASSGGKTGFNYRGLKNSIGAFAQPVETLICPNWLTTLPAEQMLSGYAEMLKTGLLEQSAGSHLNQQSDSLWNRLLQYDLDTMPLDTLTPLIADCVAVKERIVAADPKEEGLRKALNLGHTFGHALEEISFVHRTSSLRPLLHGYAVLYGLIAELYLSVTHLGCPREPLQQLTQLMLHYYGRPQCKCSDRAALIALMQQDKKNERAAEINCTLLQNIGSPVINRIITPDDASEAWDYLFSL